MKRILSGLFLLWLIPTLSYAVPPPDISSIANKQMGIAAQSMRDYDTNLDGKKDRFDYYERGKLVTVAYDYDQDGKIDEKNIVKDNKVVERHIQKDGKTIFVVKDPGLTDNVHQAGK